MLQITLHIHLHQLQSWGPTRETSSALRISGEQAILYYYFAPMEVEEEELSCGFHRTALMVTPS